MKASDLMDSLEAFAQVFRPAALVIQESVNHERTFPFGHYPSETESDEEPPVRFDERAETIVIDGILGSYNPKVQEITIFRNEIRRVAEHLNASARDLTYLVRLHEWAHALLHVGLPHATRSLVAEDESRWPQVLAAETNWFNELDPVLHERLAQLLTYHALKSLRAAASLPQAQEALDRIIQLFSVVTRRSPAKYQIEEYTDVSKQRLLNSIRLLRAGGLIGAAAWEEVLGADW